MVVHGDLEDERVVSAVADVGYLKLYREPEDSLIGIARMEVKFGLVASARAIFKSSAHQPTAYGAASP
jgi:hypothetical protein